MVKPVVAAAALVLTFATASSAIVVYEQPPVSPVVDQRTSQFIDDPNTTPPTKQFGFHVFDNFTLTQTFLLEDVHWRGSYFNSLAPDPTIAPPANATGFGIRFHASTGTDPGALLMEYTLSPAEAGETFVGTQPFTLSNGTQATIAIYDYNALLSVPFPALAGTEFWLSIYAIQPFPTATEAQWAWVEGAGGDGIALQFSGFDPNVRTLTTDRAFALTVTEPGTLGLVAAGLIVIGFGVRRRRRF